MAKARKATTKKKTRTTSAKASSKKMVKKTKRVVAARPMMAQPMMASTTKPASMSVSTTNSQLTNMFVAFLVANSVILYIAHMLFPTQVVLGTHMISPMMGLLYSTVVMTLLTVSAVPVIEWFVKQIQFRLSDSHWMILYLLLNTGAIWLVSRFAELLGFGIASWVVAVVLGVLFDVVQGLIVTMFIYKK